MHWIIWDAVFLLGGSLFTLGVGQTNTTSLDGDDPFDTNSTIAPNVSTIATADTVSAATDNIGITIAAPVKKFVAAAVRSHFDDCPDSHSHFCFHGTCRFLVQEETPACVCHPGFVGMRCEHADLLAVVATNQRQQTVATAMVLCVIGCVLIMLLCTLLHCWWRRECQRRSYAHRYGAQKAHRKLQQPTSCFPPESVV